MDNDVIHSLMIELRRGTLVLSVLSQLNEPEYGYSLVKKLESKNMSIEAGTLYPLLRRLEKQKILTSEWDTNENRPRKFYVLNTEGRLVYTQLKIEWTKMSEQLKLLIREDD